MWSTDTAILLWHLLSKVSISNVSDAGSIWKIPHHLRTSTWCNWAAEMSLWILKLQNFYFISISISLQCVVLTDCNAVSMCCCYFCSTRFSYMLVFSSLHFGLDWHTAYCTSDILLVVTLAAVWQPRAHLPSALCCASVHSLRNWTKLFKTQDLGLKASCTCWSSLWEECTCLQ